MLRIVPPFWLQTNQPLRRASSESRRTPTFSYATVVSSLALLLSCSTCYLTYFRVQHSLKATAEPSRAFSSEIDADEPVDSQGVYLSADLVMLNDGNRTETVLRALPELIDNDGDGESIGAQQGPWVLKPGDVVPMHIEHRVTEREMKVFTTSTQKVIPMKFVVMVTAINQDGTTSEVTVEFGVIVYTEQGRKLEFRPRRIPAGGPLQQLLRRGGA